MSAPIVAHVAADLIDSAILEVSTMPDLNELAMQVIQKAVGDSAITVTDETPLVGDRSILDSMKLVEVCLALEDLAEDHDFEFDWTSEAAMSKSRGMFRTAGALVNDFCRQTHRK